MAARREFDWSMHYFRAVAIVAIVLMHYLSMYGHNAVVYGFFHSASIFFLFISGYLCQYVEGRHPSGVGEFYLKKLKNVICPFLVFSVLSGVVQHKAALDWAFVKAVLTGSLQWHLWYIPFVTGLFIVSPGLCRLNDRRLLAAFLLALTAFFVFPFRPVGFMLAWPDTLYLYSYFTVFYLSGFVYCRFRPRIDPALKAGVWWFAALAALVTALIACQALTGFKMATYDLLMGLQKFFLIAVLLVGVSRLKPHIWLLDRLAKYSFALYFMHFDVFEQFGPIRRAFLAAAPLPQWLADALVFLALSAVVLLAAMALKKLFGRFSRPLLGA